MKNFQGVFTMTQKSKMFHNKHENETGNLSHKKLEHTYAVLN